MAIEEVKSNGADYADMIPASSKKVVLRKHTLDDPLTWDQNDNNFEILRGALNETIQTVESIPGVTASIASVTASMATVESKVALVESSLLTTRQELANTESSQTVLQNNQATIISNQSASENLHTITIAKVAELESEGEILAQATASLYGDIGDIKTEHVARTYVINHVLIKWKTTTTESQKREVTTALGLTYDSRLPLTTFDKYLLPLDGRRDAGYVIPILSLHEYVEVADYNGVGASY